MHREHTFVHSHTFVQNQLNMNILKHLKTRKQWDQHFRKSYAVHKCDTYMQHLHNRKNVIFRHKKLNKKVV